MTDNKQLPTDFKAFVEIYKPEVYNKICEYLQGGDLEEHNKIMRVYVDRKGQYRRPCYVLAWAALYGGNMDDAILPAAIQQVSEEWLLMLDDWMDGNTLRRGGPAAHTIFDSRYVINAASHLQTLNWLMVFEATKRLGAHTGERYFRKFFDIMQVTHAGQYLDMSLTNIKDITKFSLEDYYKSIHAKAGYYTVYGPMQQGAIVAGVGDEVLEKIPEYGIPAGQAFQIKDDILDNISTNEILGKSIGNDVREGCKNIILWHTVQNASPNTLKRLKEIYMKNRKDKSEEDVRFTLDTFKELGSIEYAQKEAERLSNVALEKFNAATSSMPETPAKALARSSIGHTAVRSK